MEKTRNSGSSRKRKGRTKKKAEISQALKEGLCERCIRESACSDAMIDGETGLYCSEFEPRESLGPKGEVGKNRVTSSEGTEQARQKEYPYRGLCSTCVIRETCSRPKPEWGVWHCDEYR